MKITKRQLRRIIKETITESDPRRPWGSYSEKAGDSYSDTIVMSPNGDSVLVDGMETYLWDVPQQLEIASGHSMGDAEAEALMDVLEDQRAGGYVELSVEYKDGRWSW